MKLFELLEIAKETGDIIVRKNQIRGCVLRIRYFNKFNEFMAVDSKGNLIIKHSPSSCRVTLSGDLLNDDFYLEPLQKTEDRILDLINNHAVTIEDLEKLTTVIDYGITADGILNAVKKAYPHSCYANDYK